MPNTMAASASASARHGNDRAITLAVGTCTDRARAALSSLVPIMLFTLMFSLAPDV